MAKKMGKKEKGIFERYTDFYLGSEKKELKKAREELKEQCQEIKSMFKDATDVSKQDETIEEKKTESKNTKKQTLDKNALTDSEKKAYEYFDELGVWCVRMWNKLKHLFTVTIPDFWERVDERTENIPFGIIGGVLVFILLFVGIIIASISIKGCIVG